jgi:catechol 2,3-dioxygenase-like lactoylglutathione lyase family enzyme
MTTTAVRIANVNLWVFDQEQALEFYVGRLGFEIGQDVDLGFMRWLTVHPAGRPDVQLILCNPDAFGAPEKSDAIKAILADGLGGGPQLQTDDVAAVHAELVAAGVEFTQGPTEMPYGTDCELIDPFGNRIRIVQPAAAPAPTAA